MPFRLIFNCHAKIAMDFFHDLCLYFGGESVLYRVGRTLTDGRYLQQQLRASVLYRCLYVSGHRQSDSDERSTSVRSCDSFRAYARGSTDKTLHPIIANSNNVAIIHCITVVVNCLHQAPLVQAALFLQRSR